MPSLTHIKPLGPVGLAAVDGVDQLAPGFESPWKRPAASWYSPTTCPRLLMPVGWVYLRKIKKQGRARFLGLSGHSRPANFVRMIEETGEVEALLIAMNFVDRHTYGFEEKVLPVARKRGVGVMAMKVFGGIRGSFPNYSAKTPHPSQMEKELHRDAIRYIVSLEGVTGMVIGVHDAEQLRRNIELVLAAKPLPPDELQALVEKGKALAGTWGPRFGPVA